MRPSLAIKTLFRAPGKTIVTFLLLAALTFSLFLQVAEYTATKQAFEENIGMYVGTGYVEKEAAAFAGFKKLKYPYYIATDPRVAQADTGLPDFSGFDYPSLTADEVAALDGLRYVSSGHLRYMTAGRSEYPRLWEDHALWDNNSLAIVEGTLQGPCYTGLGQGGYHYSHPGDQAFYLSDSRCLAGDLDIGRFQESGASAWQSIYLSQMHRLPEEGEARLEAGDLFFHPSPFSAEETAAGAPFVREDWTPTTRPGDGNMYASAWWAVGNIILKNYPYGTIEQNRWTPGDHYVLVLRFSHQSSEMQSLSLNLYDWISEHFCPAVWNITDAPENYLELPEYAPLKQLMEIIESDHNTLDVVYAEDMRAIKLVHNGKMALTEGRWLTEEDTASKARVCVLDEKFAKTYGLKVGDTLPLELGDALFEQFYNLGAVAGTVERYADNWTDAAFEVVGLYKSQSPFSAANEPNWSYSVNTVFVPLSVLPETVDLTDHEYAPGEFTFRVDNAWDIAPFLEETAPKIEEMGLTLMFDDGGWMEVYKPYMEAQRISLIRIALLAVVTVMATAFVVYLFISRKRKDYAIMRALGTPKRRAGSSMLLPLLVLAMASVIVGLAAATLYIGKLGELGQPPVTMALLCGLAELLLTLLLALGMLRSLSRQSPLALLQGGSNARKPAPQSTKPVTVAANAAVPAVGAVPRPAQAPLHRKPRPLRFVLRYVFRHIRRSAVKSLLAVLVAALMLSAVAQLSHMRGVYERLQTDTVVTARFNMSLTVPKLRALTDDGLASDVYYEQHLSATMVNGSEYFDVDVEVTNDIAAYAGDSCEISYAPGYGPEDLAVSGTYAVLGAALLEQYGLAPGDTVYLCKRDVAGMQQFYVQVLTELLEMDPDMPVSVTAAFERHPEQMKAALRDMCDCFTVIGTVTTGNGAFDELIFTAGVGAEKDFKNNDLLEYVEFRLPDNARAQEMKNRGEEMTGHRSGAFSIDIEKLESVERTAALLETLYPIVIALTLLIGAFLCALIIMQTTKDAAIMRILGTTKAMTRSMLSLEQILLAVLGVAIGLGVMAAIHRTDFAAIAARTLCFGGVYIAIAAAASVGSATVATKKNLLELLQTKE